MAPDAGHRAWAVALGGCIALTAAMGIGRFVYTPILPFMEVSLSLTKFQAGLIASANFLGYLVGALAAAKSGLRGGHRIWFLGALAVSALTTAAMGLTTSIVLMLILRLAGGVASALVMVFAATLILERLATAGRPGLSALHFAGVGSGIAISAVLVDGLASSGQDWRMLWLASGGLSLLALAAVSWLVPTTTTSPAAAPTAAATATQDRRLIKLILAYGLLGFGYVITATFISTMVRESPEIHTIEPLVWLTVGLAAIPSVAFWTWVGQKIGNSGSFAVASLVLAVGVALSVLNTDALAVLTAAALLGGTFMGMTAVGLVQARQISSGDPRRAIALMTAAFGLGQMIGPTFAGYTYGLGDSFLVPSLVASAALVVGALLTFEGLATRCGGRQA